MHADFVRTGTRSRCSQRLALAGLTLALLVGSTSAQVNWAQQSPAQSPPPRYINPLANDPLRGRTVLFGGRLPPGNLADTWEWDGANWAQLAPAVSPSARYGHALAFDFLRRRVVMFGGTTAGGPAQDTWEFDGANWTLAAPAIRPSARTQFAMAYDLGRGRLVLFGGVTTSYPAHADTWEWDGVNWTQQLPAVSPSPRCCHVMAYDSARRRTVLFGGYNGTALLSDTWEWDGTSWIQRSPAASPAPRCCNAMTFDRSRGRTVLFGGASGVSSGDFSDTWEWDGTSWIQRSPSLAPSARRAFGLVYDDVRDRTVIFGGGVGGNGSPVFGDTWEFFAQTAGTWATLGSGCTGSAGVPVLTSVASAVPWTGENFTLRLTSIPGNAVAVALVGSSKTSWPPITLPFSLAALGMPGCTLYVSGQFILPVPTFGGIGTLILPIPNDASLVGSSFHPQVFVTDAAANPAGLTVSNGGEGRIGAK